MVSPRSIELKQGAKEEKLGKLNLPVEIKRTARIHCGGRVPTGAIASRNPVKEEKVPTPSRRLARICGMKRKDYKEVSPEPKDYGDSDYSDDRSPMLTVKIRQPSHEFTFGVGMSFIPYPLVLTPVV
jgi:hypothetical protein